MNILAFDTSTEIMHAALRTDSQQYIYSRDAGLDHASSLPARVHMLLDEAAITAADLDAVACGQGPGSFTGLRIGFGFAKGICASMGIPLIAIPSLDLFAARHSVCDAFVLPVIDARKDRFYTALYRNGRRLSDYLDASFTEIIACIESSGEFSTSHLRSERVIVGGPHAPVFLAHIQAHGEGFYDDRISFKADPACRNAAGELLLNAAEKKIIAGSFCADQDGPIYVRQPI